LKSYLAKKSFENSTRDLRTDWFSLKKEVVVEAAEKENTYELRFFNLFQKFYFKKLGIFLKNQLSGLAPQNFKNTFICGNIWEEKRFVDFKPRYGVKSNRFSKKFEIS
jgi:hypothetical protein